MSGHDNGSYDESLLLVIAAGGLVLLLFFALTPVLRPYYALMMPAVIAIGAGAAWALLRTERLNALAIQEVGADEGDAAVNDKESE